MNKMDDLGVPIIFGNTHTLLGFVGKMTNIFPLNGGELNGDGSHGIESVKYCHLKKELVGG